MRALEEIAADLRAVEQRAIDLAAERVRLSDARQDLHHREEAAWSERERLQAELLAAAVQGVTL